MVSVILAALRMAATTWCRILVWEDGFCDFAACASATGLSESARAASSPFLSTRQLRPIVDDDPEAMNPELFFKMSHEVYNYGEGYVVTSLPPPTPTLQTLSTLFHNLSSNNPLACRMMGKVAVDNSHKWVYKEPLENEISFLSPWHASLDPVSSSSSPSHQCSWLLSWGFLSKFLVFILQHPRTWEAQFKSGIQTIAVVAVQEGVLQLGSTKRVCWLSLTTPIIVECT